MTYVPYTLDEDDPQAAPLGLIVLQVDETIEPGIQHVFHGPEKSVVCNTDSQWH